MTKQELYDNAKSAYYNGEPIMSDAEFDELERELGLENKGYVGTHHQKSYTVKHPFIMGSLSKIQIKEKEDHSIDFADYVEQVKSYLRKSNGIENPDWWFEVGPKYDGCSFEAVIDKHLKLVSVSTRGDGEYGKDIKAWFEPEFERSFEPKLLDWVRNNFDDHEDMFLDKIVVRGECLVRKSVFKEKYAQDFTMPRSFVAGCLNQDWEGTDKQKEMRNDLSWICYDYRETFENGVISEIDYTPMSDKFFTQYIPTYSSHNLPGLSAFESLGMMAFLNASDLTAEKFKELYYRFDNYRKNICEFELDGFVIKPGPMFRIQDGDRARQEDCVAIKFLPEIVDAELIDIEWNVGKTGEYFPTGILKEVILGGKKVNRVSLHNYDYVMTEMTGIGTKLKVSLAGDIIPFVYQVVKGVMSNGINLPNDCESVVFDNSNCMHLMKKLSETDKIYIDLIASVNALKIDGIGEKVADKLFEIYQTGNIINFMSDDVTYKLNYALPEGKSRDNIISALQDRKRKLTLVDVIMSCNFENCGEKNALWLAKKISGLNPDSKGIPTTIQDLYEDYKLLNGSDLSVSDANPKLLDIEYYIEKYNIPLLVEEKDDKTPIIMTGEPSNTQYRTKKLWLEAHPKYKETTSFKEAKILFTGDMSSTSGKMAKAKKAGIEIRLYED